MNLITETRIAPILFERNYLDSLRGVLVENMLNYDLVYGIVFFYNLLSFCKINCLLSLNTNLKSKRKIISYTLLKYLNLIIVQSSSKERNIPESIPKKLEIIALKLLLSFTVNLKKSSYIPGETLDEDAIRL